MIKSFLLILLGGVLIGMSCYNWDRVSEPGVLTQEVCSDIPVGDPRRATCTDPENIPDSTEVTVDSITGDTTRRVISRRMFLGRPNGTPGYFLVTAGVLALIGAAVLGYKEHKNRDKRRKFASNS